MPLNCTHLEWARKKQNKKASGIGDEPQMDTAQKKEKERRGNCPLACMASAPNAPQSRANPKNSVPRPGILGDADTGEEKKNGAG